MDLLVVGLGNPGVEYQGTRHNIGFTIVDELVRSCGGSEWKEKWQGLGSNACWQGKKIFFLKPQTFMNCSGESVARYHNFFKLEVGRILVIHDDLDMPLARVKLIKGGGNGGHNGIRSLVCCLRSRDFFRLKIGIGRPGQGDVHPDYPVERYVLARFTAEQKNLLEDRIRSIFSGFSRFVTGDIAKAMEILNSLKARADS